MMDATKHRSRCRCRVLMNGLPWENTAESENSEVYLPPIDRNAARPRLPQKVAGLVSHSPYRTRRTRKPIYRKAEEAKGGDTLFFDENGTILSFTHAIPLMDLSRQSGSDLSRTETKSATGFTEERRKEFWRNKKRSITAEPQTDSSRNRARQEKNAPVKERRQSRRRRELERVNKRLVVEHPEVKRAKKRTKRRTVAIDWGFDRTNISKDSRIPVFKGYYDGTHMRSKPPKV